MSIKRFISTACLCALLVAGSVVPAAAKQRERRIDLPSAAAALRARAKAEQLLRGGLGPERTLPGSVRDIERVTVLVEPSGEPVKVRVSQLLMIEGVGDYFFKVPGPVADVTALGSSTAAPGLRNGSVVWQGFSQGRERLGAAIELVPAEERARLPLRFTATATVDGEPVTPEEIPAGRLAIDITVENVTGKPVALPTGAGDVRELARALDEVHAELSRGVRPEPGRDGVPRSLDVSGPVREQTETISAPLRVEGRIVLPSGTRRFTTDLAGNTTSFATRIAATLDSPTEMQIELTARPIPPPEIEARPRGGGTWAAAVAAGRVGPAAMLHTLVRVLAETARLVDVDGYMGNPDIGGDTSTTYVYRMTTRAPAAQPPPPTPAPKEGFDPAGAFLSAVLLLVLLGVATVWWALS